MTPLSCAMWEGRCGGPAHLIVDTKIRIGDVEEPLSWLVCDRLTCLAAAQAHAERNGLEHIETRRLTPEDLTRYALWLAPQLAAVAS